VQLDADTCELRWCFAAPVDRAEPGMPPLARTEVVKAVALYQMFEEDEIKPLACKIGPQPFAEDAQLAAELAQLEAERIQQEAAREARFMAHQAQREARLDAFVSGGGSLVEFGLFVLTLTGKTIPLRAFPDTTVEELKELLQDQEGIPPDQQRLIYKGSELEEGHMLLEVGAGGCRGRGVPGRPLGLGHQLHRGPAASQRRW
jgi:hypothetical protein